MSSRVKFARTSVSTAQTTELIELPDIPGIVVLISRVLVMLESASTGTGMGFRLYHNISLALTLPFASVPGDLWFWASLQATNEAAVASVAYDPPYELVGKQRYDTIGSAGSAIVGLTIIYDTRRERNRTAWNEIRARTSFERD